MNLRGRGKGQRVARCNRRICEAPSSNCVGRSWIYTQCKGGSDVTFCTISTTANDVLGGHLLYTEAVREGVKVPDFVWATFERHQL